MRVQRIGVVIIFVAASVCFAYFGRHRSTRVTSNTLVPLEEELPSRNLDYSTQRITSEGRVPLESSGRWMGGGCRIEGVVWSQSHGALSFAEIVVLDYERPRSSVPGIIAATQSGADGAFSCSLTSWFLQSERNRSRKDLAIQVRAPGHWPVIKTVEVLKSGLWRIEGSGECARRVRIRLRKGTVIAGRVFDTHGNRAPRAFITMVSGESKSSCLSNEVGEFEIGIDSQKDFSLAANAALLGAWETDFLAGRALQRLDIHLGGKGTLRGTLRDGAGVPLANTVIHIVREDEVTGIPPGNDIAVFSTDSQGQFECRGLVAGRYAIRVRDCSFNWVMPVPGHLSTTEESQDLRVGLLVVDMIDQDGRPTRADSLELRTWVGPQDAIQNRGSFREVSKNLGFPTDRRALRPTGVQPIPLLFHPGSLCALLARKGETCIADALVAIPPSGASQRLRLLLCDRGIGRLSVEYRDHDGNPIDVFRASVETPSTHVLDSGLGRRGNLILEVPPGSYNLLLQPAVSGLDLNRWTLPSQRCVKFSIQRGATTRLRILADVGGRVRLRLHMKQSSSQKPWGRRWRIYATTIADSDTTRLRQPYDTRGKADDPRFGAAYLFPALLNRGPTDLSVSFPGCPTVVTRITVIPRAVTDLTVTLHRR